MLKQKIRSDAEHRAFMDQLAYKAVRSKRLTLESSVTVINDHDDSKCRYCKTPTNVLMLKDGRFCCCICEKHVPKTLISGKHQLLVIDMPDGRTFVEFTKTPD